SVAPDHASRHRPYFVLLVLSRFNNAGLSPALISAPWRTGTGVLARRWSLDIWKTEIVLRRSKIFIATGIQIAVSSVGAAYYGQHLHTDLHPYARALAKNTSSC